MDFAAPPPAVQDVAEAALEELEHHHVTEPGSHRGESPTRKTLARPSADSAPPVMTTISDGTGGKMASPMTTGMIQK